METHKENPDDLFNSTKWTVENEEIIIRWCDTAQCYRWLCYNSHKKYANLQAHFAVLDSIMSSHNYRHRWYMNENNNKVSNQSSPSTPTDNTLSSPPIPSDNNV